MHDVQIVGCGPAGCMAACEAAKSNVNVEVLEKQEKMRLKCSGLLSKRGLDSLGVDYKKSILNKIYGARIYSPNLNEMRVICKDVKAFVIDRAEFNSECAHEAESKGAKIILGKKVVKSDLKSKLIIGADGALSKVAVWFGFPQINEFAFCYQADFYNAEIENKRVVDIFLSNTLFPGFFGWCIPLNESEARVGLGVFRDVKKSYNSSVKHYFNSFIEKHPVVSKIIKESKIRNEFSAIVPLSQRDRTAKDRVLLVGDSAGQVKATTGGGIIFGMNCAKIAGRMAPRIINGADAELYEYSWRKKFGRDLLLHRRIREVYNSLPDRSIERYFTVAKSAGIERFLVKYGDMDSPTVILDSATRFMPIHAFFTRSFGRLLP